MPSPQMVALPPPAPKPVPMTPTYSGSPAFGTSYRAPHMVLQTTTSAPVSDREPSGSRLPPIPNPELTGRSTSEQAVIVALQAVANYPNSSDFVRAVEQRIPGLATYLQAAVQPSGCDPPAPLVETASMDVEIAAGPSNSASAATGSREEAGRKRLTEETASVTPASSVNENPTSRPPPDKRADVPRPQLKSVVIPRPPYRVGHLGRGAPQMSLADAIEQYGDPDAGSVLPVPPDPVDADRREPEVPQPPSDQSISPTHRLPQLFSDHERALYPSPQKSSPEKQPSILGTSAPLLTNPSLTSFLNNYPIWPAVTSLPPKSATEDDDARSNVPTLPTTLPGAGTAPSFKRGRGRPPKTRKRLVRAKARTRKKETTTTMPLETAMPTEASEVPRYQLRSRRQPRYRCGTCGLRDCVCLLAVNENRRVPTGARGVPPERRENLVHRLTVRAEKTYSSLERHGDHPVDTILEKLSSPGVAKAPCPRFKEWNSDGKGLEFTLATVMPPVPINIAFGPFNFEREPLQMV